MEDHHTEFDPNFAQKPGDLLKDYLEARDIKVTAFAKRCGRPQKTISEILAGALAVTPETAIQFERVLGISASIWLEFENRFQLARLQTEELKTFSKNTNWIDHFPWQSMQDKKYIAEHRDPADVLLSLLEFFGVSTPIAWENYWPSQHAKMRFKTAQGSSTDMYALLAWLRKGEASAVSVTCEVYDALKFKNVLVEARSLTMLPWAEASEKLVQLCNAAGVVLVFVPDLPKTFLRGAAYWASKSKAVILLSDRMKEEHKIWFAFFHEAMHVLHHSKKSIYIDYDKKERRVDTTSIENEADDKAADLIIPKEKLNQFLDTYGRVKDAYTVEQVADYARSIDIDPSFLAARLQHEKLLSYNKMAELRRSVAFED